MVVQVNAYTQGNGTLLQVALVALVVHRQTYMVHQARHYQETQGKLVKGLL